jgi:hypothetical protein
LLLLLPLAGALLLLLPLLGIRACRNLLLLLLLLL